MVGISADHAQADQPPIDLPPLVLIANVSCDDCARTRPFFRFLLGDLGAAQVPSFLRKTGENVITRRTSASSLSRTMLNAV